MTPIDARRAFGFALVTAILIATCQYVISVFFEITGSSYNSLLLFEVGRNFNHYAWVMPMLAALPFAAAFCVDWKSRSAILQMVRIAPRAYIRSKLLLASLTGGIVYVTSTLLFFGLTSIRGTIDRYQDLFTASGMWEMLFTGGIFAYMLGIAYLQFIAGAFFALSGLTFSSFFPNAYLTLCFPMLIARLGYGVMSIELLPDWANIGMLALGATSLGFWPSIAAGTGIFGGLSVICCALFCIGVRRRLEHG